MSSATSTARTAGRARGRSTTRSPRRASTRASTRRACASRTRSPAAASATRPSRRSSSARPARRQHRETASPVLAGTTSRRASRSPRRCRLLEQPGLQVLDQPGPGRRCPDELDPGDGHADRAPGQLQRLPRQRAVRWRRGRCGRLWRRGRLRPDDARHRPRPHEGAHGRDGDEVPGRPAERRGQGRGSTASTRSPARAGRTTSATARAIRLARWTHCSSATAGVAAPATLGQGFLIDRLALFSGTR